jgi:hypothetical protein
VPVENEHFADEALRIIDAARTAGVTLRVLGSIAYRIHCPAHLYLFEKMDRALTDIDFAAEKTQQHPVQRLFTGLGYVEDRTVAIATEGSRHCFTGPDRRVNVDVFMDELFFCHRIPLKGRLALDEPTITVTDLLLEKMQIVEINLKDLEDTVVLLLEHDIGEAIDDRERIDVGHVCSLLCSEWGFYHTVTTNLGKVEQFAEQAPGVSPAQREVVKERIRRLTSTIEARPKSLGWKMRARVGTRMRWYQEVSGKEATYLIGSAE